MKTDLQTPFELALRLADEISRLDLDTVIKERVAMTNLLRDAIEQRDAAIVAENKRLREALALIARSDSFAGGTSKQELQGIARAALSAPQSA